MSKKGLGYLVILGGVALVIMSILADISGIGNDPLNFGWKQILGTVIGSAAIIAGILILISKKRK